MRFQGKLTADGRVVMETVTGEIRYDTPAGDYCDGTLEVPLGRVGEIASWGILRLEIDGQPPVPISVTRSQIRSTSGEIPTQEVRFVGLEWPK